MIGFATVFATAEETPAYGEPEWMPSPDAVTRARVALERRGVVQGFARGTASKELVRQGEAPWPWLLAGVLWIAVWPAVIALRIGQGWLATWLPWWLPLLLAVLHALALAGPVLFARRDSSQDTLKWRFGQVRTVAEMLALEPSEFETWVGMLFQLSGYRVKNTQTVADHGIDLEVSSPQVRYGLVQCKRYRGTVGEPTVRDLFGTMTHEKADFAWLATTGGVSRQAREWAMGKQIELWDGQKLAELAKQHR